MLKQVENAHEKKTEKGYSFTINNKRYFLNTTGNLKLYIIENETLNGHTKDVGRENVTAIFTGANPKANSNQCCPQCGAFVKAPYWEGKLCIACWKARQ
jgi:hypothetical protein